MNVKLQNVMMLLRKCCNHPHLVEYPYNPETEELIIDDRVIQASGKMLMLDRMIPELIKQGHKVNFRRINIPVEYLRWSILRMLLMAFSR